MNKILNYTVIPYVPMSRDSQGRTKFHKICENSDMQGFVDCIDRHVYLNAKDGDGLTALHKAVVNNNDKIVIGILESGGYPDVPDHHYKTPLHIAVEARNEHMVHRLLKYGANPHLKNCDGHNCFDKSTLEIRNILFNFKTQFVNIPNVYIKAEMKVYLSNVSDVFFAKLTVEMCVTWPHFIQNDDVTHLVIGQDEDVNIAYLVAMLKGVYIVFDDWTPVVVKGNWLMNTLECVPDMNREAILRAVENTYLNKPRLFHGMYFHFPNKWDDCEVYGIRFRKKDLALLVEIGGGTVLRRFPPMHKIEDDMLFYPYHSNLCTEKYSCCYFVIYDERERVRKLYGNPQIKYKTTKWLVEVILKFEVH